MSTAPNQSRYKLAKDGDSRERRWADELLPDFGSYETFWRDHIVPLTFRSREPKNYYFRPSVSKHLLDLADAAYATFFHLSECHAWRHRMRKILEALKAEGNSAGRVFRDKSEIAPSEALYCFFSHAVSMLDSSMHFGDAVNQVLSKYRGPESKVFTFWAPRNGSQRLESWNDPESERAYKQLSQTISKYRNALVHRKPVFVLTPRIPRPAYIGQWSGLAAICKAVPDRSLFFSQSEWVNEVLDRLLTQMHTGMKGVWAAAATALEPLLSDKQYLNDQRHVSREDERLTLKEIRKFISLTRMG